MVRNCRKYPQRNQLRSAAYLQGKPSPSKLSGREFSQPVDLAAAAAAAAASKPTSSLQDSTNSSTPSKADQGRAAGPDVGAPVKAARAPANQAPKGRAAGPDVGAPAKAARAPANHAPAAAAASAAAAPAAAAPPAPPRLPPPQGMVGKGMPPPTESATNPKASPLKAGFGSKMKDMLKRRLPSPTKLRSKTKGCFSSPTRARHGEPAF